MALVTPADDIMVMELIYYWLRNRGTPNFEVPAELAARLNKLAQKYGLDGACPLTRPLAVLLSLSLLSAEVSR